MRPIGWPSRRRNRLLCIWLRLPTPSPVPSAAFLALLSTLFEGISLVTRASALDRGGARLGGLIELGLSKYVFCDHFGFVYALALEECDRVVAARTIGSAPPGTSSSLPASISASSPFPPPRARPSARTQLLMPWPTMLERSRAHAMHRSSEF